MRARVVTLEVKVKIALTGQLGWSQKINVRTVETEAMNSYIVLRCQSLEF